MTDRKPVVFVVDDEQIIADTLALILNGQGYAARAFYAPRAVLDACEYEVPELLTSDVVMPEMTGVELAITMQTRYPACKLMLFSGQSETSMHLEKARKEGFRFEVQPKPTHPVDLLERLKQLVQANVDQSA